MLFSKFVVIVSSVFVKVVFSSILNDESASFNDNLPVAVTSVSISDVSGRFNVMVGDGFLGMPFRLM